MSTPPEGVDRLGQGRWAEPGERDEPPPATPVWVGEGRGARPRWWPLVAAVAVLAAVIWPLASTWSGIRASHPAYLVTLLAVGAIAVGVATWAALTAPRARVGVVGWIARAALALGTVLLLAVIIYPRPLTADGVAVDALRDDAAVDVSISSSRITLQPPAGARPVGLVFYPGAKVDPRAYGRILRPIAEAGYPVVILKLPFNIAYVALDAAEAVIDDDDDAVERWVVGGHSLGGVAAARFAGEGREGVAGLLLWASFPSDSIADADGLDVLSVSGSADELTTPDDVEASRADLPPGSEFVVVDGAVHAFFGDYGSQRGDGEPTTTRADAQAQIVAAALAQLRRLDAG